IHCFFRPARAGKQSIERTTAFCKSLLERSGGRRAPFFMESPMTGMSRKSDLKTSLVPQRDVADVQRRQWLGNTAKAVAGAGLLSLVDPFVRAGAWAAGSDAPEKAEVRIGFIPLTDCASVVMASVLGIDQKYGVKIVLSKEASWAAKIGRAHV